jgi:hypothetical protein
LTFTVDVAAKSGAVGTGTGSVTVLPRMLTAEGVNVTTDAKSLSCKTVATFTDNMRCWGLGGYKATVTWSDGVTSDGVIYRSWKGEHAVKTSRSLPGPGVLTGTVMISTADGTASTTASFSLTVNAAAPLSNYFKRR